MSKPKYYTTAEVDALVDRWFVTLERKAKRDRKYFDLPEFMAVLFAHTAEAVKARIADKDERARVCGAVALKFIHDADAAMNVRLPGRTTITLNPYIKAGES